MNVLNLYAGLGGNRKHWSGHRITAVELDPKIAAAYAATYPEDRVEVADAHAYLLENFHRFDVVWSSPPCQSHSRMIRGGRNRKPRYPDMGLYEEVLFLQHHFSGVWVVENVAPYYEPLIRPTLKAGRHLFWSNAQLSPVGEPPPFKGFVKDQTLADRVRLLEWLGLPDQGVLYYGDNHCPTQVLRNCVHPLVGKQIFEQLEIAALIGPAQ